MQNLFAVIDEKDEDAILLAHVRAASEGAAQHVAAAQAGRRWSAHALMCEAVRPALELALRTQSFQIQADIVGDPAHEMLADVARGIRAAGALAVRLSSRALEEHAHEVGYATHAWFEQAVHVTHDVLQPAPQVGVGRTGAGWQAIEQRTGSAPSDVASLAAVTLAEALEATEGDRMAVPLRLSATIGLAGAVFMLAAELTG